MKEKPIGFVLRPASENPDEQTMLVVLTIDKQSRNVEDQVRQLLVREMVKFTEGNKGEAAKVLGISLKNLYNRLNEFSVIHASQQLAQAEEVDRG